MAICKTCRQPAQSWPCPTCSVDLRRIQQANHARLEYLVDPVTPSPRVLYDVLAWAGFVAVAVLLLAL